jgi:hypothetical protein
VSNRFDSADLAMQTGLCRQLGVAYPIISAPMGPDISGPDLVAAVSNCSFSPRMAFLDRHDLGVSKLSHEGGGQVCLTNRSISSRPAPSHLSDLCRLSGGAGNDITV